MTKTILLLILSGFVVAMLGSWYWQRPVSNDISIYITKEYGLPFLSRSVSGPLAYSCDYSPCVPADVVHDQQIRQASSGIHSFKPVGLLLDTIFFAALSAFVWFERRRIWRMLQLILPRRLDADRS